MSHFGIKLAAKFLAAENPVGNADELGLPTTSASMDTWDSIISTAFMIIGALSVILIIVGGFRYVTSAGNPDRAKSALQTITYAIIGLIISISAVVIINFVVAKI